MNDEPKVKYTQRDWDRIVGWGVVPPEYAIDPLENADHDLEADEK